MCMVELDLIVKVLQEKSLVPLALRLTDIKRNILPIPIDSTIALLEIDE